MSDSSRPLAGLRVLDFSRLFPGPYCTLLLAQLGAEVIKVEDTETGDLLRRVAPVIEGDGALFRALNQGKQSVSLDLKQEAGRAIAWELAADSDVVVEGFRPGVAARLGIDFPTLSAGNSRLVYCSISGFGQEGEFRDLPGHDLTYAAMSGLLDALDPGEPRVPGVQLVDAAAAFMAAVRILAALQDREHGPQYLDVSLFAAARSLMPGPLSELAKPQRDDSLMALLGGSERNDLYRCADGRWLAVSPLEEPFWQRLDALLRSEGLLAPDEDLTSSVLRSIFARRSSTDWFALLSAAGIPVAPVRTLKESGDGQIGLPSSGANQVEAPTGSPRLGEHTLACLQRLGYPPPEIARLHESGVVRSVRES